MTFDKEAYWKEKNARKILGSRATTPVRVTKIVCRRCKGSSGQFVKGTFFCSSGCDQNSLWDRILGFFGLGNWRVVYPDGLRSMAMSRRKAETYAALYDGILLHTTAPIVNPDLK